MTAFKIIVPPSETPVSLQEARFHLALGAEVEYDELLELYIRAATEVAQDFQGRSYAPQTLECYFDAFSTDGILLLPRPPLIEVTGIFYFDAAGDEQEFTGFDIDSAAEPGRVLLSSGSSWPSIADRENAVRVRYRAGYVSGSPEETAVPADIKAAILMHVGTMFAVRENIVVGSQVSMMPWGAEKLLRRKRVELGMA